MEKIETMAQFWSCADKIGEGFFFAMLTDEILWERWPISPKERALFLEKEKKVLEVRIFNRKKELRISRGDIGRMLRGRCLDDEEKMPASADYFDEEQYLDIDSARSKELFAREQKVLATGGGCYPLPLSGFEDAKLVIRNYLGYYEETGQAYVKDWRLMDLYQEKGRKNGGGKNAGV